MTTTSFSESFKYGSRLFGFYLAILVVGGGMAGAGAYLAVPEVQAWLDTGSAETPLIAGGLVAGVIGLSVLIIGQFAVLYKLIADGVSRGNADPAVDLAVAPSEGEAADEGGERAEESLADQEPTTAGPAEQPPESQPQEPAPNPQPQPEPSFESQPQEPARPPADTGTEQQEGSTPPQPAETTTEPGREQTAEEIVFGSSEDSEEPATEENTGEFNFEEEPRSRENVETAGDSSSDPLADNFDEE